MRSAQAREDEHYGVGAVGGAYMGTAFAGGVEAFRQASRGLSLGIAFTGGYDRSQIYDTSHYAQFQTHVRTALAQARWFPGNSFYVKAGAGVRATDATAHDGLFSRDEGSAENVMQVSTRTLVAGVGIGNMWTFDSGFYIGGEWAGYYAPLASSSTSSIERRGVRSEQTERLEKAVDLYAERQTSEGQVHLAVLTIGSMF